MGMLAGLRRMEDRLLSAFFFLTTNYWVVYSEKVTSVPKVEVQEVIKEVERVEVRIVERIVEVPEVEYRERIVEVPKVHVQEAPRLSVYPISQLARRARCEI